MEVQRATFEKIYLAQSEIIFGDTGIDVLIEKNETVHPKSRRTFMENIAIGTVGKGLHYRVTLRRDTEEYDLGSVSEFVRKIIYYEDTPGNIQIIKLKGQKIQVSMKELWTALRESLAKPFDEALMVGIQYSSEIFRNDGGPGFVFDPDTYKPKN